MKNKQSFQFKSSVTRLPPFEHLELSIPRDREKYPDCVENNYNHPVSFMRHSSLQILADVAHSKDAERELLQKASGLVDQAEAEDLSTKSITKSLKEIISKVRLTGNEADIKELDLKYKLLKTRLETSKDNLPNENKISEKEMSPPKETFIKKDTVKMLHFKLPTEANKTGTSTKNRVKRPVKIGAAKKSEIGENASGNANGGGRPQRNGAKSSGFNGTKISQIVGVKKPTPPKRGPPPKCAHCAETKTPEWRKGPYGSESICNACGLFFKKLKSKFGPDPAIEIMKLRKLLHQPRHRVVPASLEELETGIPPAV